MWSVKGTAAVEAAAAQGILTGSYLLLWIRLEEPGQPPGRIGLPIVLPAGGQWVERQRLVIEQSAFDNSKPMFVAIRIVVRHRPVLPRPLLNLSHAACRLCREYYLWHSPAMRTVRLARALCIGHG